jgi:pilus assembly protein Flp/PilA
MLTLWNRIKTGMREEAGQTAVEYTLLLALIALAIIVVSPTIRTNITAIFTSISSGLASGAAAAS